MAVNGTRVRGTSRRRHSAVDLRSGSESKRQFETFVAGHEARVESAKLRAASESSGSRPSATDRLRLLRERVAAKQAAGLAGNLAGQAGADAVVHCCGSEPVGCCGCEPAGLGTGVAQPVALGPVQLRIAGGQE